MKCCLATLLICLVVMTASSQSGTQLPGQALDSVTGLHKINNDAASFIYAYLDAFLANPTEKQLIILEACEQAVWRPLQTPDEHIAFVILQCNKGYYLGLFGDINKAVDAYETAWKIYSDKRLTGFDITEYCLKPLGNNYSILGDYQSAANIIKHYLFIAENENNVAHLASAFINLSIVYHDTGRQEEAVELLKNALAVKSIQQWKKGIIYSNLARNTLDLQRKTEAYRYAMLAMQHLKGNDAKETLVYTVNTLKILSLLNLNNGDTTAAQLSIENAKKIVSENPSSFKKRELAKLMAGHAGIHEMQHRNDAALQNYQQALMLLMPGYKPKTKNDLPGKALLYPENAIKEILDGLATLYAKSDAPRALACFELSFEVESLLRHTYHYQADRLQQQAEIRNRTGQALTLLHTMFEQTKKQHLVRQAFQWAERTKAVVLREAIDANTRYQFIKHDTLLKREHDLTYKKAKLASDLVLEQMKGEAARVAYINELMARQTELSIEIKSLQQLLAQKYHQYNTIADPMPIDVDALQRKLGREDATLVAYAAAQEDLYVFVVDAHSISFHKITDAGKIYDNIRVLNDLFSSSDRINSEINLYKEVAFELTRALHIPAASASENLVIVPDGLLNYVPFEALLFQESNSVNYASLSYLVKKFTVAYTPSASSFNSDRTSPASASKHILAMFPVFRNSTRMLKYSEVEAKQIRLFASGEFLFDHKASKKAFEENLHDYNIIHLSTHAGAGSWLAPPSIDFIDSTLYLPEVYGLRLQPDLMVLSACETGVGKVLKGEGALSLARGFQYAGVRNIIFSLWKVNDLATARLMSSFYEHYFNGFSKPQALRRAKLDYLQNKEVGNLQKSPYFWAAFVYYGDVDNESLWQYATIVWAGAIILALASLFMLILLRIKRHKKAM